MIKYLTRNKKEGLIWAYSLRGWSLMAMKAEQQEYEVVGHTAPTVRK